MFYQSKILFSTLRLLLFAAVFFAVFLVVGGTSGATPDDAADITSLHGSSGSVKGLFVNAKYIVVSIGGTDYTFMDDDQYDSDHEYLIQGSDCDGRIWQNGGTSGPATSLVQQATMNIDVDFRPPNGSCTNTNPNSETIILDGRYANIWAEYTGPNSIKFLDQNGNQGPAYTPVSNVASNSSLGTLWARTDESSCNNLMIVSPDKLSHRLIKLEENKSNGQDGIDQLPTDIANFVRPYFPSSCEIEGVTPWDSSSFKSNDVWNPPTYVLGNSQLVSQAPGATIGSGTATGSGGSGGTVGAGTSCEDNEGEFVFFMCAILRFANDTINTLDSYVRSALEVKPEYYSSQGVRDAWANIRNVAYILLIPIMLVMVIGTALGFGFLDAYTVKRALPRLLAAIIFMALSFDIARIMIEVTTVVGQGLGGLIATPFGGSGELTLTNIFSVDRGDGAAALGVGVIGGVSAVAVGAVGIGIIASYLLVGAIALVVIFALLTIREMLVLFLIILAPIAIVAWIFPGNDKLWKLWWGTFTKLLLLYPLIIGLLMMGRVFAYIMATVPADGVEGVFLTFAKLVAYIAPFFLIPAAFKFAGGVFGNLAGMVNNREKGLFDRQRKYRGDKRKEGWQSARTGNRFKGGTQDNFRGRLNTAIRGSTNVDKAGLNPLAMRSRMRTALNDQAESGVDEFSKSNEFKPISGDDAKLWAARFENREDIARELETRDAARFAGPQNVRARNDAVEQILRAQQTVNRDTFQRARLKAQASTGTGYQNAQGEFDASMMLEDINATYGNDRNGAAGAIAQMRGALTQSGQIAGQAGFSTWAGQAEQMYRAQNSNLTAAQRQAVARNAHEAIMDSAIDSAAPQYALHGKPSSARAMGAAHQRRIQAIANAVQAGQATQEDLDAALAGAAGIYDAMSQANPQNASAFANELMGVTIAGSQTMQRNQTAQQTRDLTVRELIQDRDAVGPKEYIDRRRNQYQAYSQAAQNQTNQPPPPQQNPLIPGGP